MTLLLDAVTDSPDTQIQITIITGIFSLLAILLAALAARIFSKPKTPDVDPDEKRNKSESLLATYSGEQNEFIRLVINDSKDMHDRLDRLDGVVERMKKERTQLISAFARYVTKLANAWGSGGSMPYPDEADRKILEETLPAGWRHPTKD